MGSSINLMEISIGGAPVREFVEAFHSLGAHSSALGLQGPCQHGGRVFKNDTSVSWGEQQNPPRPPQPELYL